jgi:hypothetical protein
MVSDYVSALWPALFITMVSSSLEDICQLLEQLILQRVETRRKTEGL